jgi:hypothetical protein
MRRLAWWRGGVPVRLWPEERERALDRGDRGRWTMVKIEREKVVEKKGEGSTWWASPVSYRPRGGTRGELWSRRLLALYPPMVLKHFPYQKLE